MNLISLVRPNDLIGLKRRNISTSSLHNAVISTCAIGPHYWETVVYSPLINNHALIIIENKYRSDKEAMDGHLKWHVKLQDLTSLCESDELKTQEIEISVSLTATLALLSPFTNQYNVIKITSSVDSPHLLKIRLKNGRYKGCLLYNMEKYHIYAISKRWKKLFKKINKQKDMNDRLEIFEKALKID